jgi:hypothetical protein
MNNIDISTSYNFITTSSINRNDRRLAFHYNNFYKKFHELMSELNKIKNSKNNVNKIKIGLIEKNKLLIHY